MTKQAAAQAFSEKPYVAIPMAAVESGQLSAIGYDCATHTLAITFKFTPHAVYQYPDVLPETYEAFMEAESKGTFFKQHIKPLAFEKYPAPKAVEAEVTGAVE